MSADLNSGEQLIQAVQTMLGHTVLPALSGFEKYNTRIAINVLGIALRQQQHQAAIDDLDSEIAKFTGCHTQKELAQKIMASELIPNEGLFHLLKRRALLQMSIDNPNYWGYQEALRSWQISSENESTT